MIEVALDTPGIYILRDAARDCLHCGLCTREYCNARPTNCDVGEVASAALKYPLDGSADVDGAIDELGIDCDPYRNEAIDQARRCALCDKCTQGCPAGISCRDVMWAVREAASHDPKIGDYYRMMRTNYKTNTFTLLRELMGLSYDDEALVDPDPPSDDSPASKTLFMPGCTLNTYAPALTRAIFDWLKHYGYANRITALCCGNPLKCTGDVQASASYRQSMAQHITAAGIAKVLTACPNCVLEARHMLKACGLENDVSVSPLASVFADAGVKITRQDLERSGVDPNATLCVHDSCPDRNLNEFGAAMRAMLSDLPCVERKHHGKYTLCCGSGGLCTSWNGEVANERGRDARAEVAAAGGTCVITACVSCTNAYSRIAGDGMGSAQGTEDGIAVRNYLEILFGIRIDWPSLREAQGRMYSEQGNVWRAYMLEQREEILPLMDDGSQKPGAPK